MVRMAINDYLDKIRGEDAYKPKEHRRPIPTQLEMAQALGLGVVTMNRIINLNSHAPNHRKHVSLEQVDQLLKFLHSWGFEAKISDLVVYEPD